MPRIRHARPDELSKLAAVERSAASLFREVGSGRITDGDTMEPALLAALCRDRTVWVAVDATDDPVAFLAAHALDGRFHVAEVSVARSHQRRGIGTALIAAAVDHAGSGGFSNVTLTTDRDLPWNGPFYSKLGFLEVGAAEAGPEHVRTLRAEAAAGHDASKRCVMTKAL